MVNIIETAKAEHEALLHDISVLGAAVGKMKQTRAAMLMESDLKGDSLEVMRINEKLHNARRVLNAWNQRREHLAFTIEYLMTKGSGTDGAK